ncbi:MAG: phosphoribosylformylglycinamidine synthase subunit PurS, partial [Planctomycetota bacterium]
MTTAQAADAPTVHRIAVAVRQNLRDPAADRLIADAQNLGIKPESARTAKVYLIEGDLTDDQLRRIRDELLVDPVTETDKPADIGDAVVIEVHPLPGVTDPAAQSVASAIESLLGVRVTVQTGRRYELVGVTQAEAESLASRLLANTVVHRIHAGTFHPAELPKGTPPAFELTHVPIRDFDDAGLMDLSKQGHLFLDLTEMKAIQGEYQTLGREPTD